jgi:hypothetical protein
MIEFVNYPPENPSDIVGLTPLAKELINQAKYNVDDSYYVSRLNTFGQAVGAHIIESLRHKGLQATDVDIAYDFSDKVKMDAFGVIESGFYFNRFSEGVHTAIQKGLNERSVAV